MIFKKLSGFDLFRVKKQNLKNRKNTIAKTVCPIIIKKSQFSRIIYIYNILKFHRAVYYRTGDMDLRALALRMQKNWRYGIIVFHMQPRNDQRG